MKVYIKSFNGRPVDDWGFIAYLGYSQTGTDIHFFEEIQEVPLLPSNIVITWIDETKWFLKELGVEIPKPLNIPTELKSYTKRNVEVMTLKEFKKKEQKEFPLFVKPHSEVKQFGSGVLTKASSTSELFHKVPDDTLVETCSYINIVSEYRGFVINGELKMLSHYSGDFRVYPDCSIIEQAIKNYTSAPVGYSIDFGVNHKGETILIECNDGWSLGSYGCPPATYTKLLTARWLQMTKNLK